MAWLLRKIEAGFPEYLRFLFRYSFKTYIDVLFGVIVFSIASWVYLIYLKLSSAHDEKYAFLEIKPTDRTLKTPLSTNQLYTVLHPLVEGKPGLFCTSNRSISLEIASTKEDGIRFILRIPHKEVSLVTKNIYSYLPGVEINQIGDYFSADLANKENFEHVGVQEMKLSNSYLLPLENQDTLNQVDPIAYLTGQMTQLTRKRTKFIYIVKALRGFTFKFDCPIILLHEYCIF